MNEMNETAPRGKKKDEAKQFQNKLDNQTTSPRCENRERRK